MNGMPELIKAIEQTDDALNSASLDDPDALFGCLNQRSKLILQATETIDDLRKRGHLVPPEAGAALKRSYERGDNTLRQLILAKHQIASQLTQLKQEQLLLNDLTVQPETQSRICDVMG